MPGLTDQIKLIVEDTESALQDWLSSSQLNGNSLSTELKKAITYSLMGGGKRFRPSLVLLTGEMLGVAKAELLPFACAVEMVHTYSLIHDDLPCMDDDDIRRGMPTSHKVFGEDIALLAGDLLLTESFGLVATSYLAQPAAGLELIRLMAEAAGAQGMVNGQVLDILAQKKKPTFAEVELLHGQKTGALIRLCVEGVAVLAKSNTEDRQALRQFGQLLGLGFQIADDILDHNAEDLENCSYTSFLSLPEARQKLSDVSLLANQKLTRWGARAQQLQELVLYNQNRKS